MIFLQADLSFEADAETLSLFTNLDFDMDDDTCEKIGSGETLTTSSDKETEGQTDNSEERTTDEEEDDEEENAETMVHSVEQNSGKDYLCTVTVRVADYIESPTCSDFKWPKAVRLVNSFFLFF